MLNKSGESGGPCLVPDLRGNVFSYSPLSLMLAVGLTIFCCFLAVPHIMQDLLVPQPGIEPTPLALGVQSQSLDGQGRPGLTVFKYIVQWC